MAALTTIALVAGSAVAAGGTLYSAKQQRKAASAQRQAATYQKQQQQLARSRARRDAIRQARLAHASSINSGANTGTIGSSGVQGGAGSILSQGASNVSFLDESGRIADMASEQLGKARMYTSRAQTGAAIASIGQQVAGWGSSQGGSFGDAFSWIRNGASSGKASVSPYRTMAPHGGWVG